MQLSYDYTRILVHDFRACFRFYRDVLGLEPGFGSEDDTYADFPTGSTGISLFDAAEMAEAVGSADLGAASAGPDAVCLVFGVTDVDEAWSSLVARGAVAAAPPTDHPDWGIRTVHLRDPDGHLIEINSPIWSA
jgi:predicted enzyme related to lactoylglutathione lyase